MSKGVSKHQKSFVGANEHRKSKQRSTEQIGFKRASGLQKSKLPPSEQRSIERTKVYEKSKRASKEQNVSQKRKRPILNFNAPGQMKFSSHSITIISALEWSCLFMYTFKVHF